MRLGDDAQFHRWSIKASPWGPDDRWRVWFAGGVVDGLLGLLDEHLANYGGSGPRAERPCIVGCVPWLASDGVVDRLVRMAACCLVSLTRRTHEPQVRLLG
jgi:hypothetical protein